MKIKLLNKQSSPKPGPSTEKSAESPYRCEMSDSESDNMDTEPCCVCNARQPIEISRNRSVKFVEWAQCDVPADDKNLIQVSYVDLNVRNNTKYHHTDKFDITDPLVFDNREELVVRRGQEFVINVEFNRPFDSKKDDLRVFFQQGKSPKPSRGSHVEFILSDRDVPKEWGAYIKTNEENYLSLVVNTSSTCAVRKWWLKIDVVKRSKANVDVFRYIHTSPIYIFFNPWCKGKCCKYILFFEDNVLDCVMLLLDKSYLSDSSRGDPIAVVRMISKMVNAPDDGGVLAGNWSGDYKGGTSPLKWTGSKGILEQYYKTRRPVLYGQCWVFSGVLTTVCRALGIPARSVTNFASAHDTDGSITIDCHFDQKGRPLKCYDEDSVWNFHVWNDVWLARPDLPPGYGGWQAIDATPQERSGGVYCMGPMSLLAVKRGEVYFPYDGRFLFAEVNADKVYWRVDDNGAMNKVSVQKCCVGQFISTKRAYGRATWTEMAAGFDPDREDITEQYKFKEGNRMDVEFDLQSKPDTFMGDSLMFCLVVKNTSVSRRTVNGTLMLSSMYYTGVLHKKIKEYDIDRTELQPKAERYIGVQVKVDEYLDKLTDHCICNLSCMCFVDETKQVFAEMEELILRKPQLTIKAPGTGCVRKKFKVEVSFENPLPVALTKCELRVDGPGVQRPIVYRQPNVHARTRFTGKFETCPEKPGEREIIVCFNCAQIESVNVSHWIKINDTN
ncbi:hemocyte protein-glutamine gamma-glutamyltransferase-like [Mercenaria mercenaria]|uniref:hemocyte protein-glutamine gamma-glutamyltransferase-like n=1 Tax=Mercenaria mercenaria TaxID=6596 RepID=UPI00234E4E5A|nr:hemocyte protein-glutamine gamma-glutamyltransferase-like [Mercenaria mercenaria]